MTLEDRFWAKVRKGAPDECWEWTAARKQPEGYGFFKITPKMRYAHRVCWELEHGAIPDKLQVLHRCDNPPCVNPRHLFLGTHADNMEDRNQKKRQALDKRNGSYTKPECHPRGERSGRAKLTEKEVLEMRELCASGTSRSELGRLFGVSQPAASAIVLHQTWQHVGGPRATPLKQIARRPTKLSDDNVREIRRLFDDGAATRRELSVRFHVSHNQISRVVRRLSRQDVL